MTGSECIVFSFHSTISLRKGIFPTIIDNWLGIPFYDIGWKSTVAPNHEFIYMSSLEYRSNKEASGITEFGGVDQYWTIHDSNWQDQRPALDIINDYGKDHNPCEHTKE